MSNDYTGHSERQDNDGRFSLAEKERRTSLHQRRHDRKGNGRQQKHRQENKKTKKFKVMRVVTVTRESERRDDYGNKLSRLRTQVHNVM